MAAASANALLLKVGNGASPEVFTTLAAMRSTGMTFNNSPVDITTKDSSHWRTLLAAGGVKSVSISVAGVFTDAAVEETFRAYAFAQSLNNMQIVFPNNDTLAGSMMIENYERNGDNDAAEMYTASISSSGTITYTAG